MTAAAPRTGQELVVVPETDSEPAAASDVWEELLLLHTDHDADADLDEPPLPAPLAHHDAVEVLGEPGVQLHKLEAMLERQLAPEHEAGRG